MCSMSRQNSLTGRHHFHGNRLQDYRSSYGALITSEAGSNTVSSRSAALTGIMFTYPPGLMTVMRTVDSNQASAAAINDNPQGDAIAPSAIRDLGATQGPKAAMQS